MKPRVCCFLPPGPEADVLIYDSQVRKDLWEKYLNLEFSTTDAIPHGFEVYVCPWFMVRELLQATTAFRSAIIAFGPDKFLPQAFEDGVEDYMKSPWGIEELQIRARRLTGTQGTVLSWATVVADGNTSSVDGIALHMAESVHQMFHILVSNAGRVLSTDLLLKLLQVKNLQSRTLSVYISEIRKKLSLVCPENPMDLVRTHYGKGFSVKP